MSVDEYVKNVYDKDYYHLSDEEKNKYLIEFDELKSNTEVNFKEKMRKMFNIFLNMNEKFSKAIKEYDSDGFASVRSAFMDAFINSTDGQIDYIKLLDRLNDINTTLTKNGYPKYSLDSQTFINVGKFLLDNNIIKKNTTDSNKAVIVQDLYKYISDTYNTQNQEEATKLADKMWTMYQLYNNINKQVPIKNLDIDSFIELVETGKYNDGEKQLTLQLNNEEKNTLKNEFSNLVASKQKLEEVNTLLNKLNNGEEISLQDLSNAGLYVITNPDGSINNDDIKETLINTQNRLQETLNKSVNDLFSSKIDNKIIEYINNFQNVKPTIEQFSDDEKIIIEDILNKIGLPE